MFRNITLLEAFERVAEPDEWIEFCSLEPANDIQVWILSYGDSSPPSARELQASRYRELWGEFARTVRNKLIAGEWVAEGFDPQFGAAPVPISPTLWRALEFVLCEDRVVGAGFKFANLSFSEVKLSAEVISHRQAASLRRALVSWIEELAAQSTGPMTKPEVRASARLAFSETKITDHMFNQAWGVTEKPEHFRQRGRPERKLSG